MSQSKNTAIAVVIESVPNTYEAPTVGTDFDELADITAPVTDQEVVERTVVRSSLGNVKTRRGSKIGTLDMPLELKSSNTLSTVRMDRSRTCLISAGSNF